MNRSRQTKCVVVRLWISLFSRNSTCASVPLWWRRTAAGETNGYTLRFDKDAGAISDGTMERWNPNFGSIDTKLLLRPGYMDGARWSGMDGQAGRQRNSLHVRIISALSVIFSPKIMWNVESGWGCKGRDQLMQERFPRCRSAEPPGVAQLPSGVLDL